MHYLNIIVYPYGKCFKRQLQQQCGNLSDPEKVNGRKISVYITYDYAIYDDPQEKMQQAKTSSINYSGNAALSL